MTAAGDRCGPLLFRPWLLVAGVCFGLAVGTKWTALYPLAVFGVLVWVWSAGARRSFGVRWSLLRAALVDGAPAFAQLVLVAGVVYMASWTGWLVHADEYEETLSSTQYTQFVAENGCTGKGDDRTTDNETDPSKKWPTATEKDADGPRRGDPVAAVALVLPPRRLHLPHALPELQRPPVRLGAVGWLLVNRPVGVATDLDIKPGEQGCEAAQGKVCYRQVLLIGTPLLWWGGCVALLAAGVLWLGSRDWRYGVPLVGMLSTWLPWLLYDDRPIFFFYAIACLPFLVLAVTLVLGKLIGSARSPTGRRTVGVIVAGSFVVLVMLNFAYFYPILSYELITRDGWLDRMWFARWI